MIIVDTNILIYLYIQGEYTAAVESLVQIDCTWSALILWRSEFRNVLALYLRKQIISLQQALDIITQAANLMRQNEYQPPSDIVLNLFRVSNCSAYDCAFVSLAIQFNVPLITQDKKILTAFPDHTSQLNDYIVQHRCES